MPVWRAIRHVNQLCLRYIWDNKELGQKNTTICSSCCYRIASWSYTLFFLLKHLVWWLRTPLFNLSICTCIGLPQRKINSGFWSGSSVTRLLWMMVFGCCRSGNGCRSSRRCGCGSGCSSNVGVMFRVFKKFKIIDKVSVIPLYLI